MNPVRRNLDRMVGGVGTGELFAQRYRVLSMLGSGGIGSVYAVEDNTTRRRRALKVWDPRLVADPRTLRRFQREVLIGAEIESEHIVEVLDAGVTPEGTPYLVMELLVGTALDDHLRANGPMAPDAAMEVLTQVGRALAKAHVKGIIHRDLKPGNIFLTYREDGSLRVKILDFGLATLLDRGNQSQTTAVVGTPLYMPPEQLARGDFVSPATDLYALGLIAFEMLTGMPLRGGAAIHDVIALALNGPDPVEYRKRALERGVALPPAFDAWLARATAREPSDRWSNGREMIEALGDVLNVARPRRAPSAVNFVAPPDSMPTPRAVPAMMAGVPTLPEESPLGITQDLPARLPAGFEASLRDEPEKLQHLFRMLLPPRLAGDAAIVIRFLSDLFTHFRVVGDHVVALERDGLPQSEVRFFAAFMLELDSSAVHTRTFVDYAAPLADALGAVGGDHRSVVLCIVEATELGRGVRDVIHDFRERFRAQIVPLHVGEVRRSVNDRASMALLRERLDAMHPRIDVFETRAASVTTLFGIDTVVGHAVEALRTKQPFLVISGAPGSGKTSVVDRIEYDLRDVRFVRVRCVEVSDRTMTGLCEAIGEAVSPDGRLEGESAAAFMKRALESAPAQNANAKMRTVVVLEDADWLILTLVESDLAKEVLAEQRAFWGNLFKFSSERLAFIVTGTSSHILGNDSWSEWTNPLARRVTHIALPPLRREDLERMINELGREIHVTFDRAAVDRIAKLSGLNVYVARKLCSRTLQRRLRLDRDPLAPLAIGAADVRAAARDLSVGQDLFDLGALGVGRGSLARRILGVISRSRPRGVGAVLAAMRSKPIDRDAVVASIARLTCMGLVEVRGGRFEICVPLLNAWLKYSGDAADEDAGARPLRWLALGVAASALMLVGVYVLRSEPAATVLPFESGGCHYELRAPTHILPDQSFTLTIRRECAVAGGSVSLKSAPQQYVAMRDTAPMPKKDGEEYGLIIGPRASWPAVIELRTPRVPAELLLEAQDNPQRTVALRRDWAATLRLQSRELVALAAAVPTVLGFLADYRDGILKLLVRLFARTPNQQT